MNSKGRTIYTKDDFYCKDSDGNKVLNLNVLSWEAPSKCGDTYGFIPGDEFYDEICSKLKSFKDRYRSGNVVRKIVPNSNYDIIATFYPETKMISWFFRKSNEYEF